MISNLKNEEVRKMSGVSVEAAAVAGAISLCQQSIQQFNKASDDLNKKYQAAGTSWKDSKYQQLGGIVRECATALSNPIKQLEECVKSLAALQKAIAEYEQTSIR